MNLRNLNRLAWLLGAAAVVYKEVSGRTELLAAAIRGEDTADLPLVDTLAAYAEPVLLPEPLLRSKAS